MTEKSIIEQKPGTGTLPVVHNHFDFVVIGAGPAGIGAALIAARNGLKVALINDRSCLGGNCSVEVRVPPIGAHYVDKNFVYRRETGTLEELLLYNLNHNPQQNVEMWNLSLQTMIYNESNISLFLSLSIQEVEMSKDGKDIVSVKGYCMETECYHVFDAPLFADCTGNGTVGYLAKVPFMRRCEGRDAFNESNAKEKPEDRENGTTIMFTAKDVGKEIHYQQPDWVKYHFEKEDLANRGIETTFMQTLTGFWWLEWGGVKDSISDMQEIHMELRHIAYAIWDYMKNRSGIKEQLKNYDLEWVGLMPGRRENRRFIGDYILTQHDIDDQRGFYDDVMYAGLGYDEHATEGVFNKDYANSHVYQFGPFEIPLRCFYSKTVNNLFMAGRNFSASHVAFTACRNMWTCYQMGEAVGAAAAACVQQKALPRQIATPERVGNVHRILHRADHAMFSIPYQDEEDVARNAKITVSSELESVEHTRCDGVWPMQQDCAYLFPVVTDHIDKLEITVDANQDTVIEYEFYEGREKISTIPGKKLSGGSVPVLRGGKQIVALPIETAVTRAGWHFLVVKENPNVSLYYGYNAPTGLMGMYRHSLTDVENPQCVQLTENRDWDYLFDYWKKPAFCLRIYPKQRAYSPDNLTNAWSRPTFLPNIWISQETDFQKPEYITLSWDKPQTFSNVDLIFDSYLDEFLAAFTSDTNCRWEGYEHNVMPGVVKSYKIYVRKAQDKQWTEVVSVDDNYQRLCKHSIESFLVTEMKVEIRATNGLDRVQVYAVRAY